MAEMTKFAANGAKEIILNSYLLKLFNGLSKVNLEPNAYNTRKDAVADKQPSRPEKSGSGAVGSVV
jgi:hypothetical protein